MNDNHLSEILETIAQERISDDMDLWNNIQELTATSPDKIRRFRRYRNRWLLVAIIAMMSFGVVGVLAQGGGSGGGGGTTDPGIRAAEEQGLITMIEQTQSVDNFTVTLHSAYADANRLTISYTTEIEVPAEENESYLYFESDVQENNGVGLTQLFGSGGGGGGGGNADAPRVIYENQTLSFDLTLPETLPQELDLTLTLDAREGTFSRQPVDGTSESDPILATITFDFTVPLYPGMSLSAPQSASANDIDMTVRNLVVTTSLTRMELCLDEPLPEGFTQWLVYSTLQVNGVDVEIMDADAFTWQKSPFETDASTGNCSMYFLPESLLSYEGDWQLTIPYLVAAPVEVPVETLAERLFLDYGIEIDVFPGGGFGYGGPEDLSFYIAEISRDFEERPEGPWVFNFNITR